MLKRSLKTAAIFAIGAFAGKGLYMLVEPHPEYYAPIWLQLAVPVVGAFIGSFIVAVIIQLMRKEKTWQHEITGAD